MIENKTETKDTYLPQIRNKYKKRVVSKILLLYNITGERRAYIDWNDIDSKIAIRRQELEKKKLRVGRPDSLVDRFELTIYNDDGSINIVKKYRSVEELRYVMSISVQCIYQIINKKLVRNDLTIKRI
jgi:hypothetical protein